MSGAALTGFLAWLEASPPGSSITWTGRSAVAAGPPEHVAALGVGVAGRG